MTKALRAFSAKPHTAPPSTETLLDSIHTLLKLCSELETSNPELVLDQAARSPFLQQHLHSHPKCFNATLQLLNRAASSSRTYADPLSISQLAVAQVRLGVTCPLFWQRFAGDHLASLSRYPMEQIVNLTWAAAKLDVPLPPAVAGALRGAALRVLPACNPRNVTTLLWAYASSAPLRMASDGAAPRGPHWSPLDDWSTDEEAWGPGGGVQANALDGSGHMQAQGTERPSAVPSRWRGSLEGGAGFDAQPSGGGADGVAALSAADAPAPECGLDELCDALVEAAQRRAAEMVPRGLSTCLWAVAALGRAQDRAAAAGVAERALAALPELSARGTSNVAWACAKLEVPLTDAQAAALAERTIHFCMPYMHESEADKGTARSSGGVGGPGALGSTAHRPQAHDAFTALGFANAVWALGALGVTRSVSFTAVAAAAAPQPEDDSTADVDPRDSAGGSVDGDSAQSSCTAGAVAGVHATRAGDKAPAPGQSSDLEGAAPCTPPLDAAVRGDPEHVAEPIGWGVTEGATAGGPANEVEAQLAPLLAASRRLLPTCSVPELVSSCTGLSKLGIALPAAEQALVMQCVAHHVTEFSAIEIAAILTSCSRLGIPWGVQQDTLLATFVLHAATEERRGQAAGESGSEADADEAVARVPPQATANIVWAAARGRGAVFADDDPGRFRSVLENAARRFNGQEVANVLWALGVGGHRVEGRLARRLQTAARDAAAAMSAQELACTCGGLVKTGMGLGLRDAGAAESVWEGEEAEGGKAQRRRRAGGEAVAEELQAALQRSAGDFTSQTAAHIAWALAESGAALTSPAAAQSLRDAMSRTAAEPARPMEAAVMLHSAAALAAAGAAAPQRAQHTALLDAQGLLLRRLCAGVTRTAAAAPAVAVLCSLRALLRLSRLPAGADGGAAAVLAPGGAGAAAVTALRHGVARHAAELSWSDSEDAAEALVVLGEGVPAELLASMCDSSEEEEENESGSGGSEVFVMDDMELAGVVSDV